MVAPLRRVLMRSAASAMRGADAAAWHYGPGFDPGRAAELDRHAGAGGRRGQGEDGGARRTGGVAQRQVHQVALAAGGTRVTVVAGDDVAAFTSALKSDVR